MEVSAQLVRFEWPGPVADADPCGEILYHARMRFRSDATDPGEALQLALRPLAGDAKSRRIPFRGKVLFWEKGPFHLEARVKGDEVRISSRTRLRPKPFAKLRDALTGVPGARDLEVEAEVKHFSEAMANLRACTPCQARNF